MGPRTRTTARSSGLPTASPPSTRTRTRESVRLSTVPAGPSPVYSLPTASQTLPNIAGRETVAPSPAPPMPEVQERPPTPSPLPEERPPPPSLVHSSPSICAETLNVKAVPRQAALTPPPQIKFESSTVPWKGLPLDAALWTLESKDLQDVVSRAIRKSSQESFIRVLPVDTLDNILPAELERLDRLKYVTQSKYRFAVQRRTMLLQALNSFSNYNDTEGISKLTVQLSQTTNECDQLVEELLQIADQVGQIHRLEDTHWASALAIALRKLNASYGRRTTDLIKAREKIVALQGELNDAWAQAETLAKEMDALEGLSDDDEAVIEVAEVISLNHRKSPSGSSAASLRPMVDILSLDAVAPQVAATSSPTRSKSHSDAAVSPTSPVRRASLSDIVQSGPASPTQTKLPSPSSSEMELEAALPDSPMSPSVRVPMPESRPVESDAVSVRSTKSTRSVRSTKSARTARSQRTVDISRVSSVSAARRRSQRTSMSSLRMPALSLRRGSHPPVPSLPSSSSSKPPTPLDDSERAASRVESFLDFGSGSRSTTDDDSESDLTDSPSLLPPSTIEDLQVVARSPPTLIETRDDIHVMPSRSAAERDLVAPRRSQFSLDRQHPFANEDSVNHTIPSIWLMQDAPSAKTTPERGDSMMIMRDRGHVKMGSLQRLKSLTKRYSLPFPGAMQTRKSAAAAANRSATAS
ncbi:hypothetical protein MKEN_00871100 [Mycena kentingensis (nom. inval.)]|nr:hypothetical protein MKEN_00871100 [Mycena kentingensis (nom. inval.)]